MAFAQKLYNVAAHSTLWTAIVMADKAPERERKPRSHFGALPSRPMTSATSSGSNYRDPGNAHYEVLLLAIRLAVRQFHETKKTVEELPDIVKYFSISNIHKRRERAGDVLEMVLGNHLFTTTGGRTDGWEPIPWDIGYHTPPSRDAVRLVDTSHALEDVNAVINLDENGLIIPGVASLNAENIKQFYDTCIYLKVEHIIAWAGTDGDNPLRTRSAAGASKQAVRNALRAASRPRGGKSKGKHGTSPASDGASGKGGKSGKGGSKDGKGKGSVNIIGTAPAGAGASASSSSGAAASSDPASIVAWARSKFPEFWMHDDDAQVYEKVVNLLDDNFTGDSIQLAHPSGAAAGSSGAAASSRGEGTAPNERWADIKDEPDWD
jgi:hypothetical protein